MHRLLEKLDGLMSTLVPLLYLAGLAAGTLAYFSGLKLGFALTVGVCLAIAAEVHSFLQQRRVRALWAMFTRRTLDDETRESLERQLWVQGGILAGLVAFSAYNATAFVASTWTPAPGFLPAWLQIGIRGLVVPVLFLLTGFLSPLSVDAGAILASASRDMLHHTIKTTVKQWRQRIKRARKRNLNLAPVAVALMLDAGDMEGARRVHMIDAGLARAESGAPTHEAFNLQAIDAPTLAPTLAYSERSTTQAGVSEPGGTPGNTPEPPTPPTPGTGRKRAASERSTASGSGAGRAPVLMLTSDRRERPRRADAGRRSAEARARWLEHTDMAADLLTVDPLMSTRELARRMGVGTQRATEVRRTVQPVKPSRTEVEGQTEGQTEGQASA